MSPSKRSGVTSLQAFIVLSLIVIVAGGGYWWYTSSLRQEQEPSPSPIPSPSPRPRPNYNNYSMFGFSFECPEGMVFTVGSLLGGFDHARPVSGDVQGVLEDIPEVVGVIWLPAETAPDLEAVLDFLFTTASEFIQFLGRGPLMTTTKDESEVLYRNFNASDQGILQSGIVGVWYSGSDERVYSLYHLTLPEAMTRQDQKKAFLHSLDSFVSEGWEAPAGDLGPYWPTEGWRVATPEDVGVDPTMLDEMIEAIKDRGIGVDSVMVVRNGYVVMDAYFPAFDEGQLHIVYSCTKSVVSTLIGIAIEGGYIESLDHRLLDLFPNRTVLNLNTWKEEMTLRDLLTMTAGFDARDSYLYDWEGLERMHDCEDWVQYVLDLPVTEEPGTRFEYTNGVSHLLSAIISETTGMSSLEFAYENLFGPLGIADVEWRTDPSGINWGYSGLYLTPHDMAKLGLLFLKGGEWDGEQIVSREWVEEATSRQIHAGTLREDYGYQWWVSPGGYYSAIGYMGQFIHVVPELDLIMVTTSRNADDFNRILSLLEDYVIPSVIG